MQHADMSKLVVQILPVLTKQLIPNPLTDKERCTKCIHNIGIDKFDLGKFKFLEKPGPPRGSFLCSSGS